MISLAAQSVAHAPIQCQPSVKEPLQGCIPKQGYETSYIGNVFSYIIGILISKLILTKLDLQQH